MLGKNEKLKLLFCIFNWFLFQLVQCKYRHLRPDDAKFHVTPRAHLRHNTKDDILQSTNADGESLEPGVEDATLRLDEHDVHDDTAKDQNEPEANEDHREIYKELHSKPPQKISHISASKDYCWMAVHSKTHFDAMDEVCEFSTEADEPTTTFPVWGSPVHFKVKTDVCACVALTTVQVDSSPNISSCIGHIFTKLGVRYDYIFKNKSGRVWQNTTSPPRVSKDELRGFWVSWDNNGKISVGSEGAASPFISWQDPEPFPIANIGFHTHEKDGDWIVERISSKITNQYKTLVNSSNFDEEMLKKMLETRSIAERTLQNFGGAAHIVPAGLNLGGYEMILQPHSVLFFHRLKLRNDTRFSVNYLHNDLQNMTLAVRISMHDMHLAGDYERALTLGNDSRSLFYRPTAGGVEFLLKDVEYKMEGRYRLLYDRLNLEHIISEMVPKDVAIKFTAEPTKSPVKLETSTIQNYLLRMQNDLDSWLLDYFNDFLIFFGLGGATASSEYKDYQNKRTIELNRFADEVLEHTRLRLRHQNASTAMIPSFTLFAVNGWQVKLLNGLIRGLDSIRRQSVATGKREGKSRVVNAVARFSLLKVEYDYEMFVTTGLPPLLGKLVLTADGLTARMDVRVVKENNEIDLNFKLLEEPPYQSLIVVGPANRVIGNFKHLLEHQIIAIMSNSLTDIIHKIGSVTRCRTALAGRDDPS